MAPALLATSAMNSAINETTGGVLVAGSGSRRFYDAIVTTPMRVTDIAVGEIAASVLRATLSVDLLPRASSPRSAWCASWWALLALPALVLVAFAFSAAGHVWWRR